MPYGAMRSTAVFYIDNDSDSLADALKAVGVAEALRGWLRELHLASTPIILEDKGGYHQITLPVALDEEAAERVSGAFAVGTPKPLASRSQMEKAEKAGRTLNGFDYEDYKANRDLYFKQYLSRTRAERAQIEASPDGARILQYAPPSEFSLYAYINQFKVAAGYNALVEQWLNASPTTARANLRFLLRAFSVTPNPVDEAIAEWQTEALGGNGKTDGKTSVTRLQIINPTTGKGANAPKANALSIGSLAGFWLLEYLKFVGLFTLGAPLTVKGAKDRRTIDRKTYVLRPVKVELGVLASVMAEFRKRVSGNTAVKVDVITALRFAEALVTYLRDALVASQPDPLLALFGSVPRVTDIARGFDVAFYKDMGSAFATMNLATVQLPEWLDLRGPLATQERADAALSLLREHLGVISGIRTSKGDEGSDEYELLRRYRDFFSGRDVADFLDFAALYGDYLLAKLHHNQWAGQFTTEGLDILMMQTKQPPKKFTPIIENEGFRAIAAAIRSATVRAQRASARDRSYPYDVRYGLGQELLRAAAYPQEFLAALGGFVQSYNAENARMDERIEKGSLRTHRRASIRTEDLDQIVRLIDAYDGDSELICKLLIGYGYARDSRDSRDAPDAPDARSAGEQMEAGQDFGEGLDVEESAIE